MSSSSEGEPVPESSFYEENKIYLDINCAPILPLLGTVPPDRHVELVWNEKITLSDGEDFYRQLFSAMSPRHSLENFNTTDVENFWMLILDVEKGSRRLFKQYEYFFPSLKDETLDIFLNVIQEDEARNGFYIFVNEFDTKKMWFCEKGNNYFNFNFYDGETEQKIGENFVAPDGTELFFNLSEQSVFYEIIEHFCKNDIFSELSSSLDFLNLAKLDDVTFYDSQDQRAISDTYNTSFFLMEVKNFYSRTKPSKFSAEDERTITDDTSKNIFFLKKTDILAWTTTDDIEAFSRPLGAFSDDQFEKKRYLELLLLYLRYTSINIAMRKTQIQPTNSFFFHRFQKLIERNCQNTPHFFFMLADFIFFVAPRKNLLKRKKKHDYFFNFLKSQIEISSKTGIFMLPAFDRTEKTLKQYYDTLDGKVLETALKQSTYSNDVKILVQVMISSVSSSPFMMWLLQLFDHP